MYFWYTLFYLNKGEIIPTQLRKIRFFYKKTNKDVDHPFLYFVNSEGKVARDNCNTFESQCSVISFDDFVEDCPGIDWEVI